MAIRAEFSGVTSVVLDLHPGDFVGLSYPAVVTEIALMLEAEHPNVTFSEEDIAIAAADVCRERT